ncbi:MAG: hypothetical protein KF681_04725 [Bdellovibrionaceae bacterium]|nr:hypothetical protein [Pseudobdellovibrionaceae bacterium]
MNLLRHEQTAKNLQEYIEGLLGAHQLLDCFQQTKNFSATIGISGSRPLHIERRAGKIIIGQYAYADDELLPDPEIILEMDERGRWHPQDAFFGNGIWVNCTDGSWLSNLREHRYLRTLADRWTKALADQNFERGEVVELWGENE